MRNNKVQSALRLAKSRHRRLDNIIDRRQRSRASDPLMLQILKKQRLAAKDRAAGLAKAVQAAQQR